MIKNSPKQPLIAKRLQRRVHRAMQVIPFRPVNKHGAAVGHRGNFSSRNLAALIQRQEAGFGQQNIRLNGTLHGHETVVG